MVDIAPLNPPYAQLIVRTGLKPCGMHVPPVMEGRGRGMAPRGLARLMAQPHRWKEKRGIPRPQRSVGFAGTRTGRCFTPLAQDAAGGVQAGRCSKTAGPWRSSLLGPHPSTAFTGAEPLSVPTELAPRSLRSPRRC